MEQGDGRAKLEIGASEKKGWHFFWVRGLPPRKRKAAQGLGRLCLL